VKNRYLWLAVSCALALSLLTFGYLCLTAPVLSGTETVIAAADIGAEEGWILRSEAGEIFIIQGSERISTGLSDQLLPQEDRAALRDGIRAESREALAALLEDLTS